MLSDAQIEKVVQVIVNKILVPKFVELKMDASGEWLRTTRADKNTIIGPGYTEQLVKGRAPGKMPPVDPLKIWAQRKFGLSEKEAESMAWGVAKNIAKSGTTWYQKGGSDLLEVLESKEVYDLFVELYALEVKTTLTETFTRSLKA